MPSTKPDIPVGIFLIQKLFRNTVITSRKYVWSRVFILVFTFFIYTAYHTSRKPLSVVKSVLHQNCTGLKPPPGTNVNNTNWCSWEPFDTLDSNSLFGLLDSAFLFAYAFAMFVSGFIAERTNLRYFLTIGMFMSGVYCYLWGLAKTYNIHSLWYFAIIQTFGGVFQTTGWPGVVTVMGNWFGEGKTGILFGIWNSHTSVGNILGTLIAGHFVESNWAYSFVFISCIMFFMAISTFIFLVPEPTSARTGGKTGNRNIDDQSDATATNESEDKARVEQRPILSAGSSNAKPISFIDAIKYPGVIEFSLCLFFAKLVSYTFLYWLPLYIYSSTNFGAEFSANLSTLFDVGGILGGILAGAISDSTGMQAFTCSVMLVYSVPTLYIYYLYGGYCLSLNIGLLLLTGALVNGPYALITTVVSAKLGLGSTATENVKSLSTVTAIIDGTGSIGAAVGPLLSGFISDYFGWQWVFYMLMISDVFALLMLLRLVKNELQIFARTRSHGWTN